MTVVVYRSDDAGAPVLMGSSGNIGYINVLTALVSGYGSKPGLGWTKPYTSATQAIFRQAGGHQHYLFVDNATPQYPILRGYRSASSIDIATATGPFPSVGQLAGGVRAITSITNTSVPRPWVMVANEHTFYLWVGFDKTEFSLPYTTSTDIIAFGTAVSRVPGDTMNTFLIGRTTATTTASATTFCNALNTNGGETNGCFLASNYLNDGNPILFCHPQAYPCMSPSTGNGGSYYPDPITGGMLLDYIRISEGGTAAKLIRGRLPGVFNPLHPLPGTHLDTLQGRGTFDGSDLLILYKGGTEGRLVFSMNDAHW